MLQLEHSGGVVGRGRWGFMFPLGGKGDAVPARNMMSITATLGDCNQLFVGSAQQAAPVRVS